MSTAAELTAGTAAAFDRRVFGAQAWSEKTWQETIESAHRRTLTWGATNGELVAVAVVSLLPPTADLERIAVAASKRGCGVGTALLHRVIEEAHRGGCDTMLLEVAEDNAAARALYRRFGGRVMSTRPAYYPGGADAVVLRIDLPIAPVPQRLPQEEGRHV